MKTKNRIPVGFALTLLLSTLNSQPSFAQGSLTPPGAPVPTMKTLAQVEPRTPIGNNTTPGDANSLFRITQPGSYYLTTNLTGVAAKHGIEIEASGVTLDMMGFDLAGSVTNSLDGVNVSGGVTNIAIRNGSVRNWGGDGVDANNARNGLYQDLRLAANRGTGLACGIGSAVVNCAANGNTNDGIVVTFDSTVSGCTVQSNGDDGIVANNYTTVTDCAASLNTGKGISVGSGCRVSGCTANQNSIDGILADIGSTVTDCTATFNIDDGIQVSSDCRVVDNTCHNNGNGGDGTGIHATGSDNRIDSNNVTANDRGIDVDAAGNLIIRNSAASNTVNYEIAANNKVGVIVSAPNSLAISSSTGGAGVGTTDPWANISF